MPRLRVILIAAVSCAGLTVFAAWLFDWSAQRAMILSPVVVATAGATAFLFVLWARVAWESIRAHLRR